MYDIFERLLEERRITATDVSRETGIPRSIFTDWKKGRSKPKADKLQKIADYFGVSIEYLTTGEQPEQYYLNDETAQIAQEIFEDPDLHALFDAARGAKPEDMRMAADMLRRFKETNPDG